MHFPYRLSISVLLAVALFCSAAVVRAAETVRVPIETSGEAGQVVRVMVSGTITLAGGTARITLEYPHQLVSIRTVTGSGLYSFRCPAPLIVENAPIDADRSKLVVECSDVVAMNNGPLFSIDFEFRQGAEGTGAFAPVALSENGVDVTDAVFSAGVIKRVGEGVIQDPNAEGITSIYPNPVKSSARLAFVMRSAGIAHLAVRDSRGRLAQELKDVQAAAGQNVVDLALSNWQLSSGTYLLQLTTESGSYFYSFAVIK